MKRAFIAINLPENVKTALRDILENLHRVYRGLPIRFVKPNGFHITLHFLGNQNDEMIEKIKAVINEVTSHYKKTKLVLAGFGFFPNEARPRVLWIEGKEAKPRTDAVKAKPSTGVGNRIIENLQKQLGRKLVKLGLKIDKRDWHPHITLGRISGKINTSILRSMKVPFIEWEVDSIELMESNLKPERAEYKILYSTKLT